MTKSPEAFRTISEVASEVDVPQHVLRFWEGKFIQIKPLKRGGGRRYYRPEDVDLIRGIRNLLYVNGYTIKGVQKVLREQGVRHVIETGRGTAPEMGHEAGNGALAGATGARPEGAARGSVAARRAPAAEVAGAQTGTQTAAQAGEETRATVAASGREAVTDATTDATMNSAMNSGMNSGMDSGRREKLLAALDELRRLKVVIESALRADAAASGQTGAEKE